MRRCVGVVWQYQNSRARGLTWAAELRGDGCLVCCYGQKRRATAIAAANRIAKKMGWVMREPWSLIHKPDSGSFAKRRGL